MNTITKPVILELEEQPTASLPAITPAQLPAVADNSPAAFMLRALDRGVTPAEVREMMALQREWESNEARKAYNKAMAAFKAEAVEIIKRKRVFFTSQKGTTDYKHAELSDVMEAVGPALSKHGFAWAYKADQNEAWLTVTCILTHEQGHSESVTLGGPHDVSGNKNPLQQLHSTATYLERVTLKLACGVAEKGEDNDGRGAPAAAEIPPELLTAARTAALEGWKSLSAFIKARSEDELRLLDPESDRLKAAAKSADSARAPK
jgi:hypothetical protein